MLFKYSVLISTLFLTTYLFGQTDDYKIITQDVNNFWKAVDSLKFGNDTTQIFQRIVIDKASGPFKIFIDKWKIKASDYAYQIKHYPKFYQTIREQSERLIDSKDDIRDVIQQFKKLYPHFNQADICIAFGNFYTGGNVEMIKNRNYVYIGLEYHGLDTNTFIKELNIGTQDYVSRSNFLRTIIHELVHVQQQTHGKKISKIFYGNKLANRIVSEGIPDFISKLIVGKGNNGNFFDYGLQNENNLKLKLKKELWNVGNGNWFGGNNQLFMNQPRDVGYFMGARIGESFYKNKKLQNTELTHLIEIKNLKNFIRESKYFNGL